MILVHCVESESVTRVESALAGVESRRVATWDELEEAAAAADSCVVAAERLAEGSTLARLDLLKRRRPALPLVLVTRRFADNARHLGAILVDEVVWIRDIAADLRFAVRRAREEAPLSRIAAALRARDELPAALRHALLIAFTSRAPVLSVNSLVVLSGCSRSTLWREWKAVGANARLQDLLHWIVLVRALAHRASGRSWLEAAHAIGIHEQTLGRWSRELCGIGLRELAASPAAVRGCEGINRTLRGLTGHRAEPFWGEMRQTAVDPDDTEQTYWGS